MELYTTQDELLWQELPLIPKRTKRESKNAVENAVKGSKRSGPANGIAKEESKKYHTGINLYPSCH